MLNQIKYQSREAAVVAGCYGHRASHTPLSPPFSPPLPRTRSQALLSPSSCRPGLPLHLRVSLFLGQQDGEALTMHAGDTGCLVSTPPALRPQGGMTGRRGGDAHVVQQTGEIRWCWIYGGFDLAKSVRNQINAINAYELPISSELSCSTGGCGEGRQLWGGGWQLSPLCTAACMPHARSPPAAAMLLEH